ncbi:MAG: hypothetical protein WC764_04400 [Candidatus Paceibacterota bacterium]|jgi:uncharacterized membrane protein YeaQ/YmgE (transglycosylase-associated protein family)
MDFFQDEAYMNDAVIVGLATTILTEVSKKSKWKYLAWVDAAKPEQIKFTAGAISLVLILLRKIQSGEINQGNLLLSIKGLIGSWLVAWLVSHFAYQGVPYVNKITPK